MWLAQSMKQAVPTVDADQGISTIVGDQMGVVTRGEVRQLPINRQRFQRGCSRGRSIFTVRREAMCICRRMGRLN